MPEVSGLTLGRRGIVEPSNLFTVAGAWLFLSAHPR
jgi:hypothetical protein